MTTSTTPTPSVAGTADVPPSTAGRPLAVFAVASTTAGSLLLGTAVAAGLPAAPFVLATLALGLVVPAVLLTRRDPHSSVRALLRDCVRLPRPLLLVPALLLLPGTTWLVAAALGHEQPLSTSLLAPAAVGVLSSVLVVNLWEEMAWQGYFQRRAAARWGVLRGAVATAVLFVGVHLPLAFDGAGSGVDVASGVAALVVSGLGLRLLLAGVDHASAGSLLVVAVTHASFNVSADLVEAAHDWIRYVVTLALGLGAGALLHRSGRSRRPGPR